jgi:hypothetical protein
MDFGQMINGIQTLNEDQLRVGGQQVVARLRQLAAVRPTEAARTLAIGYHVELHSTRPQCLNGEPSKIVGQYQRFTVDVEGDTGRFSNRNKVPASNLRRIPGPVWATA